MIKGLEHEKEIKIYQNVVQTKKASYLDNWLRQQGMKLHCRKDGTKGGHWL